MSFTRSLERMSERCPPDRSTTPALHTAMATSHSRGRQIGAYLLRQKMGVPPRLAVAQTLLRCLPFPTFPQVRTLVYRAAGFSGLHPRVYLLGALDVRGRGDVYSRLSIGEGTCINHSCHFDLNDMVAIGKCVGIGNDVFISTSTHDLGPPQQRWGRLVRKPVTIGDGVWIGSRVTILAGVTIGTGAMVVAGAVVTKDVPANAQVAGNPARVIGWLDGTESSAQASIRPVDGLAEQHRGQSCSFSTS